MDNVVLCPYCGAEMGARKTEHFENYDPTIITRVSWQFNCRRTKGGKVGKRMGQQIDPKIMALMKAYHVYRGDRHVRYAGTIKLVNGNELYLVRYENRAGKKYSSVEEVFCGKDGDYVTEMLSCVQEDEKQMIEKALEMFR